MVFLSCIKTFLSQKGLLKVNDYINQGVCLAKEAATISQQKKQFQHTGLDIMEVMNKMFSIEN